MASNTTRKITNTSNATSVDQAAGNLAGTMAATLAARVRELVTRGMDYDDAQLQAEQEMWAGLRAGMNGGAVADSDVETTTRLSALDARHALARIAPSAVGIVDLAILTGRSLDAIEHQLVLSGYSAPAVQAALDYIAAKRGS